MKKQQRRQLLLGERKPSESHTVCIGGTLSSRPADEKQTNKLLPANTFCKTLGCLATQSDWRRRGIFLAFKELFCACEWGVSLCFQASKSEGGACSRSIDRADTQSEGERWWRPARGAPFQWSKNGSPNLSSHSICRQSVKAILQSIARLA